EPLHADAYRSLVGGPIDFGPALLFPPEIEGPAGVEEIHREDRLGACFQGWTPGEIEAGRAPVMAILEGETPISLCFCARRSSAPAEAGLETAREFRGRGLGPRVTAAWALAIRASGRVPLYSTSWKNEASLAVARKLALLPYASDWSIARP